MFIELEGPEGSYKSTISEKLVDLLKNHGLTGSTVRQPGGDEICEEIRATFKRKRKGLTLDTNAELFLALASRSQLLNGLVFEKLSRYDIVISDRGNLSTIAIQHFAQGVSLDLIESCIEKSNIFKSDAIFTISIDIETSLRRQAERRSQDRIEAMGDEFQSKCLNGYLSYKTPEKITKSFNVIDGYTPTGEEKSSDDIALEILNKILQMKGLGDDK